MTTEEAIHDPIKAVHDNTMKMALVAMDVSSCHPSSLPALTSQARLHLELEDRSRLICRADAEGIPSARILPMSRR